ncbi:MAG: tRNA 2-thiouridine(34) synthase MnmA, partial [Armatimonadetes bacterium]|nr:tRNA 2-thiouridine(34) synthase MnmA [Armatimonadota bacterium]
MPKKPTVLVAMSGGVDSSVVAAILKERGYDVVGVTMQIWQESQRDPRHSGCCSLGAVEDARRVARILDIPFYVINYKDKFRETVIENFINEYAAGRTPNPCVQCNKKVKFEALMQTMHELGCDKLATGHYSRVRFNKATGQYRLLRSKSGTKDQSYVLHMLDQTQLSRVMFPLGDLDSKAETRKMAEHYKLPVAHKPDSQEICFVSDAGGYREFLQKERPELFEAGEMVDETGKTISTHEGVASFTVGQRRGLGVSGAKPLFVLGLNPAERKVIVGPSDSLLKSEVPLEDMFWATIPSDVDGMKITAKIRYNMVAEPARIYGGDRPRIVFDEPVRAVTPGQFA